MLHVFHLVPRSSPREQNVSVDLSVSSDLGAISDQGMAAESV